MLFQFNPADFFVESTTEGELLVTVCRPGYVAPKVRYNIHDLGHVMRFPEVSAVLAEFGIDARSLDPQALDLPVLFHYGRSDMSVAWYGCKIPPADIQETLFRTPALSGIVDGFQLQAFEDAAGDKQLVVALEMQSNPSAAEVEDWSRLFFDTLAVVNQDFRESRRIAPSHKPPRLDLHAQGTGPFDGVDVRIKRQYVAVGS
jgi:phenylacetate-CoA ligase